MDARIRYTREVIKKEFFKLIKEKPLSQITVKELCVNADINRTTFYKHYKDIYDLLDQWEEELLDEMRQMIKEHGEEKDIYDLLKISLEKIKDFGDIWVTFSNLEKGDELNTKMFQIWYDFAMPILQKKLTGFSKTDVSYLYEYISKGSSSLMGVWAKSGMKESTEDLMKLMMNLNEGTIVAFKKQKRK